MNASADDVRIACPLFKTESGGEVPTSALQLTVGECSVQTAVELNKKWHSVLPVVKVSNIVRNREYACYAAWYDGLYYAVAIWSSPVARLLNGRNWIELRRFAISSDSPKNTGSRVLSVMKRLIFDKFPYIVRLISYQDVVAHNGTIYKAAGWKHDGDTKGDDWSLRTRMRLPSQSNAPKIRWVIDRER